MRVLTWLAVSKRSDGSLSGLNARRALEMAEMCLQIKLLPKVHSLAPPARSV